MTDNTPTPLLERVARAITLADGFDDADAPIYIGMKAARAWEARIKHAQAAIDELSTLPAEPAEEVVAKAIDLRMRDGTDEYSRTFNRGLIAAKSAALTALRSPTVRSECQHEWGGAYEPIGGHGMSLRKRCRKCSETAIIANEDDVPSSAVSSGEGVEAAYEHAARVANYAVERAERDWRDPVKQEAVKEVAAEIAEAIRAYKDGLFPAPPLGPSPSSSGTLREAVELLISRVECALMERSQAHQLIRVRSADMRAALQAADSMERGAEMLAKVFEEMGGLETLRAALQSAPAPVTVPEELRELSERAALGEWGSEVSGDRIWIGQSREDGEKVGDVVCSLDFSDGYKDEFYQQQVATAGLIVASVNFVRRLLTPTKEG